MSYIDLHGHIRMLEERGLLHRITRPIDKNTELHSLVRLQFRGLEEHERKAFLFENVVDAEGRRYPFPVLASGLAPSRQIYAVGLQCAVDEISARWAQALARPLPPVEVEQAACQEVVHAIGPDVAPGGGLDMFPIPVSTPGWDPAPFLTCSHWISHDPVTGVRNVGNYRGHVKAPNRVGLALVGPSQHLFAHWDAARRQGKPLEVAICVGAPPVITYTAPAKVPAGVDELAVAGALAGAPIPVVRCKTVDVMVPADAEFVIEGRLNTEWLEPEGPFGEFYGYVHPAELARFMDVTCITHRRDAVWVSLVSQLAPSESSVLRRLSTEPMFLRHLRDTMNIKSVQHVSLPEDMLSVRRLAVIQFNGSQHSDQVRRALLGAATFVATGAKIVVAVDADIDPENLTAVWWAVATRSKPHRDVTILPGFEMGKTPPFQIDPDGEIAHGPVCDDSMMLIDATMKGPMPPVSLPKREYMERALELWNELGLPHLELRSPWHGVSLGHWNEQLDADAAAAARGDYHALGERVRARRKRVT